MTQKQKTWIILVSHRGLPPLWYGNIHGASRDQAKDAARQFVAAHLTDDAKIVRIAEGRVDVVFTGADTPFDD